MSLTLHQLKSQIRFHLADLKSRSAHHDFEHLARDLTRNRLYSNLLPATGPVSAGGDQGRDFESYPTDLDETTPAAKFRARTSGGRRIVGACTLQQKDLPGKIQKDVTAILKAGSVDEVLFFSEAGIPVAQRHKAQVWAVEQGVTLQIFDGEAIAEMLCDRDIFWIAQAHLNLPGEIMPLGEDQPEEYLALLTRWRDRDVMPFNYSDFVEVKAGLRHATFEEGARPDLRTWMKRAEQYVTDALAPRELARNAAYELCVAAFRGMGDMTPQSHRLIDYYRDVEIFTDLADLQNAATLLTYADGARMSGALQIEIGDLAGWHRRLKTLLDGELLTAPGPNRRTGLLRIRGQLMLTALTVDDGADPMNSFADWNQLVDELDAAPLFPLESFADYLLALLDHAGGAPPLLNLSARVDDAIAKRSGAIVAGEKAARRAKVLLDKGEKLAALTELHAVKRKWFSGERIGGSVRSLIMLSDVYRELGLAYAAKYHALAAAFIARHSDQSNVRLQLPDALFAAIDAEDGAGNSVGLIQLLETAIGANFVLSDNPLDLNKENRIQVNLGQISALLGYLQRAQPELEPSILTILARWPDLLRGPVLKHAADPTGFWNQGEWETVWADLNAAFIDRPWGDLGPERRVSWRALGIHWTSTFPNTYAATPIAEQFIAQLQTIQCVLASEDLALLPTEVVLTLSITSGNKLKMSQVDAAGPVTLLVSLPEGQDTADVASVVSVALAPIRTCSLLRDEGFMAAIKRAGQRIVEEMFAARPYAELYRDFTPEEVFFETERQSAAAFQPDRSFDPITITELGWRDDPGPTYDHEFALRDIAYRYERLLKCVGLTAAALVRDSRVGSILKDMHTRGLPDWQILAIIANIAVARRTGLDQHDPEQMDPEEMKAIFVAAMDREEMATDVVPAEVFETELLAAHEHTFVGAHIDSWGLTIAPRRWDRSLVRRFMTERYRMDANDIPHDDVFGWHAGVPSRSN